MGVGTSGEYGKVRVWTDSDLAGDTDNRVSLD